MRFAAALLAPFLFASADASAELFVRVDCQGCLRSTDTDTGGGIVSIDDSLLAFLHGACNQTTCTEAVGCVRDGKVIIENTNIASGGGEPIWHAPQIEGVGRARLDFGDTKTYHYSDEVACGMISGIDIFEHETLPGPDGWFDTYCSDCSN